MARLGRAYPVRRLTMPRTSIPPVFDAAGAGGTANLVTSFNISHTATAGAYVFVDVCVDRSRTVSATYGGNAMTQVGTVTMSNGNGGNARIYRFGYTNAPGGAQTVAVSWSGGTAVGLAGSVSWLGVSSVRPAVTTGGVTSPATQSVSAQAGAVLLQSFGAVGSAMPAWSSLSGGTNRYNATAGFASLAINTASSSASFSASTSGLFAWSGLANALIGYTAPVQQ